jgi:phosphoribosylformimino-5-aminoimidazole carboxamide ribotide isomerase
MMILPAIDLKGGRCVRLVQGQIDQATLYDADPVAVAMAFARAGAEMIHVVDLDGAFTGAGSGNRELLKEMIARISVPIQFGGGIRTEDDVEEVVNAGVQRVVLGTLAHDSPQTLSSLVKRFRSRICVGIDVFAGKLRTRGWQTTTDASAIEFACAMKSLGVERVIYTDIARDGTLSGVNLEQTCELARTAKLHVTASGGVSSLDDIKRLRNANEPLVDSLIVGKALYENRINLEDALIAAKDQTNE